MEEIILQTYRQLKARLAAAEASGGTPADTATKCLDIVILELTQLKKNIDPGTLNDLSGQVRFYKEMFPAYFSEVIYYRKLAEIESAAAVMEGTALNSLLFRNLADITHYLDRHRFLQRYVSANRRHLDDILFTQGDNVPVYPSTEEYPGADFFNFNSFTVSKIRAYGRAYVYLLHRLALRRGIPAKQTDVSVQNYLPADVDIEEFKAEKADINKKLGWMETQINDTSEKTHLSLSRQRIDRRKALFDYTETLLHKVRRGY